MEYNTQKKQLVIPEYGRNVHTMIDYCKTIQDREERNKFADAIVDVMANLNPHTKEGEDYKNKLWDQMYIMADYDLDVDSPYPKPDREEILKRPKPIQYSKELRRNRYYGKIIQEMIDEVKDWEDGDRKDAATLCIANQMKKNYVNWNKDTVHNEQITSDLDRLSEGKLQIKNPDDLVHNVSQVKKSVNLQQKRKRKKSKK